MRKILILTASYGNGHNAAAFSLREALLSVSKDTHVEVLDLFKASYGRTNELVRWLFLGLVQYVPRLWGQVYKVLDKTSVLEWQMKNLPALKRAMVETLERAKPDAIVSTHPAYNYVIDQIYKEGAKRPFAQMTVVTDSISINSVWYAVPSDCYFVPNQLSADVMIKAGVPEEKIFDFGFPVSQRFGELSKNSQSSAVSKEPTRLLYVINTGQKKGGRIIEKLFKIPNLQLTVICGPDAKLKEKLSKRAKDLGDHVRIFGWTNQMPDFLFSNDVVVTKAGGAMVQEALAARIPMLINQIIPGQEEGNARLVEQLGIGAVVSDDEALLALVCEIFQKHSPLWSQWKKALEQHSRPNAALKIAQFILKKCDSRFSQR